MGKEIILLNGDNKRTTNAIAKKLGLKNGLSQISTQGIVCKINYLHYEKRSVAIIGDGINHASALTLEDIGIAKSFVLDVLLNAERIILLNTDYSSIAFAFKIAKYSMKKLTRIPQYLLL